MPLLGSPLLTVLIKSPLCLTYSPCKGLGTLPLSSYSLEYTSYRIHFSFLLFSFSFYFLPFSFFPIIMFLFVLFMTHVCVLQRCCNLRDRIGWIFITCYAIIYKSILNADIDVTCDELGYILMYILLYQLNLSLSRI